MGFNAVLAAAGGARNYMARRQIDKRIKLLCNYDSSISDVSSYQCSYVNSSGTWQSSGGPFGSGCVKFASQEGTGITYGVNLAMSGAFTIGYWTKQDNEYRSNLGVMSGGFSFDLAASVGDPSGLYILGSKIGNYPTNSTAWQYVAITRTTANLLRIYVNGTVKYSATKTGMLGIDGTSFSAGSVRYKYAQGEFNWYLGNVIIVDGLDYTYNGTRNLIPTAPYTGYEAL